MTLHSEHRGVGPRLVLLHGFTQTARCWGPVGDGLARDYETIGVDAPGHGGSARVRADLPQTAELLAEVGGPALYLGYSMGARIGLHMALAHPDLVRRLVLVGGTAGIEDDTERTARRSSDAQLTQRLRSDGVDAFLTYWLDQPLFVGLPATARHDDERRRNTSEGLASSLELSGTGSMAPLWHRLGELEMPVLMIAGEKDGRYAALADRMATLIGSNAAVALVPDAGHAAHLEQPAAFLEIVLPWLKQR